jgi:hypothetical protein
MGGTAVKHGSALGHHTSWHTTLADRVRGRYEKRPGIGTVMALMLPFLIALTT